MHRAIRKGLLYRFLGILIIASALLIFQPLHLMCAEESVDTTETVADATPADSSTPAASTQSTGAVTTAADPDTDTADAVAGTLPSDFIPDTDTSLFSGAATVKVPIQVVPGRMNMSPKLNIAYNSYHGNRWMGVGFDLDMGFIQRSTKNATNYSKNGSKDFLVSANGSYSELVIRNDWGTYVAGGSNWFGSRIEGDLTKYYFDKTNNKWVATTKDGTQYFYGSTDASRQSFNSGSNVFKWCLDKVVDRMGNTITITYTKDNGEIYLSEIDYPASNKVTFTLGTRTDIIQSGKHWGQVLYYNILSVTLLSWLALSESNTLVLSTTSPPGVMQVAESSKAIRTENTSSFSSALSLAGLAGYVTVIASWTIITISS